MDPVGHFGHPDDDLHGHGDAGRRDLCGDVAGDVVHLHGAREEHHLHLRCQPVEHDGRGPSTGPSDPIEVNDWTGLQTITSVFTNGLR